MKEKWSKILPVLLMLAFALSRIPGVLPKNFSVAYALMFCAGVFFVGRLSWWLLWGTVLISDLALNTYYWLALDYDVWKPANLSHLLFNYAAYGAIILLGKRFKPTASFMALLGGGILGAMLFYLITNTASWLINPFHNPEYSKTLMGWIIALTKGTGGWPQTWEFFRNTLLSGGLFTALFVAAAKLTATAESPADKVAGAREPEESGEAEPEAKPEEAKA
ncbi:MAG: hypothetical protein M9920_05715 [Verrucomicrobiae bacterium]|nr:hypothetical protein [Verrucomicrobiae bacterium]